MTGIELSRAFFKDVVRPLADAAVGPSDYGAALLGPGSEVLGLDDSTSQDHDWGPRVQLFVDETRRDELATTLQARLPSSYRSRTLSFGAAHGGSRWIHPVDVVTVEGMCHAWSGIDLRCERTLVDWLSAPSNGLLMLVAGPVFHDGTGRLRVMRAALDWYPDDVWRWMLGCQWRRISQEDAFVGRTAQVGDDLGSGVIAARLVRDCTRLAFLLAHRYAPYAKWMWVMLRQFDLGASMAEPLSAALLATDGGARQSHLCDAYEILGRATNEVALAPPVDTSARRFHSRPIRVGPATEFAAALLDGVEDERLRRLRPHGALDQVLDSTDADWHVARPLFETLLRDG